MVSTEKRNKPVLEKFTDMVNNNQQILGVVHLLVICVAIYLSFKCNGKLVVMDLLLGLCCPYLYVGYQLAINMDKCFPDGLKL